MEAAHARARETWPGVILSVESFVAYVTEHRQRTEEALRPPLSDVELGELYLACACALRDKQALEYFEAQYLTVLNGRLRAQGSSDVFIDDVCQDVREKLFLGSTPKIKDYSGRGSLRGWVGVVGLRAAQDRRRQEPKLPKEERPPESGPDPARDYLKRRYGDDFKRAFEDSIAELPAKERTLLRLYYIDGLTQQKIGTLYKVDRATVCRWLEECREIVQRRTHHLLAAKLDLRGREAESLAAVVQSQLDISVARILRG
jgi:RNA polymerase sigma-70 factor (ECF subfamily)